MYMLIMESTVPEGRVECNLHVDTFTGVQRFSILFLSVTLMTFYTFLYFLVVETCVVLTKTCK